MSAAIGDPLRQDAELVFDSVINGHRIQISMIGSLDPRHPPTFDVYNDNQLRHIACNKASAFNALCHYSMSLNRK